LDSRLSQLSFDKYIRPGAHRQSEIIQPALQKSGKIQRK
jgi:hypothetical protein